MRPASRLRLARGMMTIRSSTIAGVRLAAAYDGSKTWASRKMLYVSTQLYLPWRERHGMKERGRIKDPVAGRATV